MTSPAWLSDILGAPILVVAAVSATRLATTGLPANQPSAAEPTGSRSSCGSGGADADIAQVLMCIAMGGMLVPSVKTLPPHAWEAIFGLLTAWFAWRSVGNTKAEGLLSLVSGHRTAHLFHCAAMGYMFAALTTSDGIDTMGMGSGMPQSLKYPVLALAFAFVLVCYSARDLLGQPSSLGYSPGLSPPASPASAGDTAATVACRIAMGMTMAFMLLIAS